MVSPRLRPGRWSLAGNRPVSARTAVAGRSRTLDGIAVRN